MLMWCVDFAILTPTEGRGATAYVGKPNGPTRSHALSSTGKATTWERLTCAVRLMLPSHRGIGWIDGGRVGSVHGEVLVDGWHFEHVGRDTSEPRPTKGSRRTQVDWGLLMVTYQ